MERIRLRVVREGMPGKPVKTPRGVGGWARRLLKDEAQEVFGVILLNSQHQPVGWHEMTRGLLDMSVIHPREAFKAAIVANAKAVIFVHNHPSGNTAPSPEDIQVKQDLNEAAEILGIPMLDFLVVGEEGVESV